MSADAGVAAGWTCLSCRVVFVSAELQRDHYKSEWHRYNLKRKVAALQPLPLHAFELRVAEHRERERERETAPVHALACRACFKSFGSRNAYDNHLNSRKHRLAAVSAGLPLDGDFLELKPVAAADPGPERTARDSKENFVVLSTDHSDKEENVDTDSEVEELDSDEWEDCRIKGSDSLIKPQDCLFCGHHSRTMVKNFKHMSQEHSFYVPDVEFCADLKGLMLYLGEKISRGFMCIWCNETGRTFYSLEAARAHMLGKGHCKMLHEGLALAEYSEFYDYSSSYPDHVQGDEEMEVDSEVAELAPDSDDYQLVLPSGAVIGHRSLLRYYKQNLNTETAVVVKKSDRKLHRVLGQYRALGWSEKEQAATVRNARDVHFMKRVQAKWQMKMSVKNNKFQTYYRPQIIF